VIFKGGGHNVAYPNVRPICILGDSVVALAAKADDGRDDEEERKDEDKEDKEDKEDVVTPTTTLPGGKAQDVALEVSTGKEKHEDLEDDQSCHTAEEGDECYTSVQWARKHGIFDHPEWYDGLHPGSSFEAFQSFLHDRSMKKLAMKKLANDLDTPGRRLPGKGEPCPNPCTCRTAIKGEKCFERVQWAIMDGIFAHPEWYEGLKPTSRFEDFQMFLYKNVPNDTAPCPRPCTKREWTSPSLFCFSVFRAAGYEPDLMRAQLNGNTGIFTCDEFAVITDDQLSRGEGPQGPVDALVIPSTAVGVSKDHTAANVQVFIHAWEQIRQDFRYRFHDWTLKVDPDAVILPDRLRQHLSKFTRPSTFLKNCNRFHGPGWPAMYGALEAFSRQAIMTYFDGAKKCKDELQWQKWGEDIYMTACMGHLGVESDTDLNLVGDGVCMGADCGDSSKAVFHPFKSPEKYMECYEQAMR
jgi:hypothetical protein